jgi:Rrf2 family iron-sulfur cluster assembly transcriptional regulator
MQFTKAEEYGLFGSVYLAKQPRGAVISLSEIADAQQVPDKFLAKIFQNLTKAGILRSHRGVRGGFSLSRLPRRVSIAEILNAVQGDLDPLKCLADGQPCPKRGACPIRDLIMEGRRHMFAYYNRQSLQELADRYR